MRDGEEARFSGGRGPALPGAGADRAGLLALAGPGERDDAGLAHRDGVYAVARGLPDFRRQSQFPDD